MASAVVYPSHSWHACLVADEQNLLLEARLDPDGRVLIPEAIRRHLGVGPGDRLIFVVDLDRGDVQLMSPKTFVDAAWANKQGTPNVTAQAPDADTRS